MYFYRWLLVSLVGFLFLVLSLGLPMVGSAQTEPPGPDMPPMPSGLDPPPTVYPPTQVSEGSVVYYLVCMACHGDQGQGLTDEWRAALDPPDQNCWQSRCHAANYPPGGFVFPKIVPAIVSPGMMARFETALDLHEYLKSEMPFQAPGSLSEQEYWQLTAYLLRLNKIDWGSSLLDAEIAADLPLRARVLNPPETSSRLETLQLWAVVAGIVSLGALIWLLWRKFRRTKSH